MSDPATDSTPAPMTEEEMYAAQVARDRAFAIAQAKKRGINLLPPGADRKNSMPVRADMTRPGAQARGVTAHVNMTHSAGARVVKGPANKHGMPAGQGANTTVRVMEGMPDVGNRAPARPNVAPRPGTGGSQHGANVRVLAGQPAPARPQQIGAKPFVRGAAPNVVQAVAPVAQPVTPLSADQMLFLSHLCDAFLVQATENVGSVQPAYVAFATGAKATLEQWMTDVHGGSAISTGTAVAPSAPAASAPAATPTAPEHPAPSASEPATEK